MAKRYSYSPTRGGMNYNCSADQTYVEISSDDMVERYKVMEDNLKSNFSLGLHFHQKILKVLTSYWDHSTS